MYQSRDWWIHWYWSSFSAMGTTDLDAMKGIPKQNSLCVCVKLGDSLKGIHYSISFLFCPDPLIGICMTPRVCVIYCTDDYWCKQHYSCCCSPSLFCGQTAGNPQKLKALNPTTQTHQNVFCCASRSSHSPDWRRLMRLCYRCHATWLLFISCSPFSPFAARLSCSLVKNRAEFHRAQ